MSFLHNDLCLDLLKSICKLEILQIICINVYLFICLYGKEYDGYCPWDKFWIFTTVTTSQWTITQYCRKDVRKYCILKLMLLKSYSKIKRLQHVIKRISRGFGLDMIFIQLVHFPSPRLRNRKHTTR